MNRDNQNIRRVLVSDAQLIKEIGIYSGRLSDIQNRIRELLIDSNKPSYLITLDNVVVCLVTFIPTDIDAKNVRLNLSFNKKIMIESYYEKVLKCLLNKGFLDKQYHKISLYLRVDEIEFSRAALKCGMIQEAVLHDELINDEGEYCDAGLFYILLPEYRGYNVGFLAFQRGIVAVYGTDEYIDKVALFKYGDQIDDYFTRSVAKYIGIADRAGCFLPKNRIEYSNIEDDEYLPSEVSKALFELKEYFLKRREKFDIIFKFPSGTSFQQAVWRVLSEIPYGSTWSYEDVALKLSSDPKEARKLTRAVGAACSENPIPIIVPCHRVIGKDGKLVGFAYGIDIKDFLLQHESLFITII